MSAVSGGSRIRIRSQAVTWRSVEGEVVALDLEKSQYLAINPSGALLWPLLVEGTSRKALVDVLTETFGLESERAHEDVDAFLHALTTLDLLEEAP